jgi:hypothetical protein
MRAEPPSTPNRGREARVFSSQKRRYLSVTTTARPRRARQMVLTTADLPKFA